MPAPKRGPASLFQGDRHEPLHDYGHPHRILALRPDAIIGYDRPLQTFFPQAFLEPEGDNLELWLGTNDQEFETLSQLRIAAIARGLDFIRLPSGILHKLLDDHAREGSTRGQRYDRPGSHQQAALH